MSKRLQDEGDVSSDSEAPEEESNVATRRSIKSIDKSRKVPKRSIAKPTSSQVKPASGDAEDAAATDLKPSDEASTSSLPAAPSHLLDPSLFAASFAKKRTPLNMAPTSKSKPTESQLKPIKKRFGKGHDGQPMKRLKDGRTIVRVLAKETNVKSDSEGANIIEETLQPPSALDPSEVLPNAKVRGFKKQKLGLRDEGKQERKVSSLKRTVRSEEDPLGLEDPAFMKGGEFEGVGLAPKKITGGRPRPSAQLRGRRTKFTPAMTKHSQALHFARSI